MFEGEVNEKSRIISGDLNVRGGLGYGGGDFNVGSSKIIFADKSGSLYINSSNDGDNPAPITPAWSKVASPILSPNGKWVLYCFSTHGIEGLALVRTHGFTWPTQLIMGSDFYLQPVWHPDGDQIAWVEWDHPYMPWDASRIKLGEVGGMQLRLVKEKWIAGGISKAANQPQFSPDGKWLSYIIRNDNWDNLVLFDLKKQTQKILIQGEGFHLRQPDWIQGMRSYGWNADGSGLFYFRYFHGETTLWKINVYDDKTEQIDIKPMEWAVQMDVSKINCDLAFLGSSPRIPKQICLIKNTTLAN